MTVTSVGNAGLLTGNETVQKAQSLAEKNKFDSLVKSISRQDANLSEGQVLKEGRLNGDYTSSFENTFSLLTDKYSFPKGAAANQAGVHSPNRIIDKTSKLYEKALELESYIVKIMLSSMRNTISKTDFFGANSFASKMYEDMMYDEYAVSLTKNAGFGLADQVYLQLSKNA
ncbi:MAG: rod-binding protein [Treponema sp.]|nr:rod-binding protein [Treponema sp.]